MPLDPEQIVAQQQASGTGLPWAGEAEKVRTVEVDPQTGRRFIAENGVFVSWMDPAPSGGGGSSVTVNASTGGAKFMVMYGPEGYGTYEVSTGVPILIGLKNDPSAPVVDPADKNGDGIDDSSGLALGVYRYAGSPTGYAYGAGQPVWPNGAPYTGAAASDDGAPELVNGKWVWDPAQKKYVIAPGMESPSNTSLSISMPRVSSGGGGGGGGGGSSASTRDYIGEIEAKSNAEAAYLDKKFALEKEMLLLEHAFKTDPNNPDYVLRRQALEAQVAQNEQQNRLQALKDFESAVSSPDMARLNARRLALGGDSTTASLLQDGGNFRENSAAAELLAIIRGMGSNNALGQVVANAAGAANPATQQVDTTPLPMTPLPAAGGTGAPATPATPALTPEQQAAAEEEARQRQEYEFRLASAQRQQRIAQEAAAAQAAAYSNKANWELLPGSQGQMTYGVARPMYKNRVTGDVISATDFGQMYNAPGEPMSADEVLMEAVQNAQAAVQDYSTVMGIPYVDPFAGLQQITGTSSPYQVGGTIKTDGATLWRQGSGFTSLPNSQVSTKPQTGAENLTTIGRLIETDAAPVVGGAGGPNPAEEPVGNRAVLPMVAYGAHRPMRGPAIVGDPQADGRPNPEVVQWTPRGNVVMPMRSLPPQTQAMAMRAMPKFAYGSYADVEGALSGGIEGMPAILAYQPKTTSRVSYTDRATQQQTAPVAPAPAPVVQPAPVAPVPAPAPVPMPMQPLPTAPVATAPVVTQPAPAPAPVTQTVQAVDTPQPAPQPAPTATTAPPAPAPAPQTVQTVGSGSVPTSPTSDPLNPTALSPAALAMLGEIEDFRQDQPLADVNTLDSAFLRAAPSFQTGVLAAKQTKYGIPVDDWANEIARFQLRGRPTMTAVGY